MERARIEVCLPSASFFFSMKVLQYEKIDPFHDNENYNQKIWDETERESKIMR